MCSKCDRSWFALFKQISAWSHPPKGNLTWRSVGLRRLRILPTVHGGSLHDRVAGNWGRASGYWWTWNFKVIVSCAWCGLQEGRPRVGSDTYPYQWNGCQELWRLLKAECLVELIIFGLLQDFVFTKWNIAKFLISFVIFLFLRKILRIYLKI